jgi:hypothetical protein
VYPSCRSVGRRADLSGTLFEKVGDKDETVIDVGSAELPAASSALGGGRWNS